MAGNDGLDATAVPQADELNSAPDVRRWLRVATPDDRSRQLGDMSAGQLARLAALLEPRTGAEILRSLDVDVAVDLLDALDAGTAASLLGTIDVDDAAEILRAMPEPRRGELLGALDDEYADTLRAALTWPSESVAAHMIPEYFSVESGLTVGAADAAVRAQAPKVRGRARVGAQIYAMDAERRLAGVIEFQDLVLADPGQLVSTLMLADPIRVSPLVDAEQAANTLVDHDLSALPVVDEQLRLLGVLTSDAAADILEEEATEDAERQGGSEPLEVPYLRASPWLLWRKRIVWLLVLFVAEAYTGTVLRAFEEELDAVVALAFFIPLLIGTGGNTGTQITTTLVRAMATGQVRLRDLPKVVGKELTTGSMIAVTMAVVGVIRAWTLGVGPAVTLTVALTLAAIVLWASLVGSVLPLLLKKIRVDPALVSGPMIATIVDGTGLILYFLIAHATLPELAGL